MISEKTLIFTVTPGRSGTSYLYKLFKIIPDVHARHEAEPNFVDVMRKIQHDPAAAIAFLREHKLPAIAKVVEPVYAETSHLTCKGFLEAMISIGLRPSLVFLGRPPREVAHSLLERNCVPARTKLGCQYLLDPRDPLVLPLTGWEKLHDYQLCFWYALEIERRSLRYTAMAKEHDLPITSINNKELNYWPTFSQTLSDLHLPFTDTVREAHALISKQRHNPNTINIKFPLDQVVNAEQHVWNLTAGFEPLLQENIQRRYAQYYATRLTER